MNVLEKIIVLILFLLFILLGIANDFYPFIAYSNFILYNLLIVLAAVIGRHGFKGFKEVIFDKSKRADIAYTIVMSSFIVMSIGIMVDLASMFEHPKDQAQVFAALRYTVSYSLFFLIIYMFCFILIEDFRFSRILFISFFFTLWVAIFVVISTTTSIQFDELIKLKKGDDTKLSQ